MLKKIDIHVTQFVRRMAFYEMRSSPQVVQQRTTLYQVQASTAENLNAHSKILSNGAVGWVPLSF